MPGSSVPVRVMPKHVIALRQQQKRGRKRGQRERESRSVLKCKEESVVQLQIERQQLV